MRTLDFYLGISRGIYGTNNSTGRGAGFGFGTIALGLAGCVPQSIKNQALIAYIHHVVRAHAIAYHM